MNLLLTLVEGTAIGLCSDLRAALNEFSRAGASPEELHMQYVIVSFSYVLLVMSCASCIGLLLVYQRNTAYHPDRLLSVRLFRVFFFLTAFSSPFLLLCGLFVPAEHVWALIIGTLCVVTCLLIAFAFSWILTESESPAPTNYHNA